MEKDDQPSRNDDIAQGENASQKKPFEEPRLTYVTPELQRHGKVGEITQGFFGSFSP